MNNLSVADAPAGDDSGLFIGLMSGTSVDGIDAAICRFGTRPELLFARSYPMPAALAADVLTLSQSRPETTLDAIGELDARLGEAFAGAANQLLRDSGTAAGTVRAIGSHGQTLRHRPGGPFPFTMQLGDANRIAEGTGITTVADFRRRDVAAGGHGAPLVPAFHAAFLRSKSERRAVLNLGGIANLSLLPPAGDVRGFDTGPGNGLMDAWCQEHRGEPFDRDGSFAASGAVHAPLLSALLSEPWFALPPPKSTGRDQFHGAWLDQALQGLVITPADVQATLSQLTVLTVAQALRSQLPGCARLLVCGGGVHNRQLMAGLAAELPGIQVESTRVHGIDPDFMEAMAFAWLAREFLAARPGNLVTVTGASGPRVLGSLFPGNNGW